MTRATQRSGFSENYYGQDLYINSAEQISGIPSSWPGEDLTIGSSGQKVLQLQEQLNTVASVYYAIPSLTPDGIYGEATANSVRALSVGIRSSSDRRDRFPYLV